MRPIKKWEVGHINPKTQKTILKEYKPHTSAKPDLEDNLGPYCGYCEVCNTTAQIDHIVSEYQIRLQNLSKEMKYLWENFILACGNCNGGGNKSKDIVVSDTMYFPDRNNTLLAFTYKEGGLVTISPNLSPEQKRKAQALMDLVCLDKYLGNPKYPKFNPSDRRWMHRDIVWTKAVSYLHQYETSQVDADGVANVADRCGYFSVWFTVFAAHKEVKKALIACFEGTAWDCFDKDYNPIPRNPNNLNDPL